MDDTYRPAFRDSRFEPRVQQEPTNTAAPAPTYAADFEVRSAAQEIPIVRELRHELELGQDRARATRRDVLHALYDTEASGLMAHAMVELDRARLLSFDMDAYDAEVVATVLDLLRVFAASRPSGAAAGSIIELFDQLARFNVLTPITSHPDEWREIDQEKLAPGQARLWQSTRQPSVFWLQGEDRWYDARDERPIVMGTMPPPDRD